MAAPTWMTVPGSPWTVFAPWASLLRDLKDLKRLALEDFQRQDHEAQLELKSLRRSERRERRRALWPRWVAFWESVARHIKTTGIVVGSTVTVIGGGIGICKYVAQAWAIWHARAAEQTALPPPTGAPSTALDFTVTRSRKGP